MKPMTHQPLALATSTTPTHIAIIMDGNGRWAKARHLPRSAGHKKGADSLRRTMEACRESGVKYLTVYAFSSENWKRPKEEISDLMQLLKHYLEKELPELKKNDIRLRFIGDLSRLDSDMQMRVQQAMQETENNHSFNLTVALSYGSKQELVRAMRRLAEQVAAGILSPDSITEQTIENALDTATIPDPDLLIRTGGEHRISNFLLWQSAYTEFFFTDTLWPDFDARHLNEALADFATRERRYGTAGNG
ncbi:MAG: isoprenyl transferase [Alphaproteobacteria bacterium]|nr:isoprenyl transferase [Alphaproteobacteria bacterium]